MVPCGDQSAGVVPLEASSRKGASEEALPNEGASGGAVPNERAPLGASSARKSSKGGKKTAAGKLILYIRFQYFSTL